MDALDLLSGDAQTFTEKIWASRVHVHQATDGGLAGLLSLDDVDHLLTSTAIRTPAVRLAQDGTVLPSSRFTRSATIAGTSLTGLVDARKVADLFQAGATIILQGLHRYWPPLTDLVRDLELSLGHPCQANAYLTPPNAQGFARHSDSHQVFVFQTHGHKTWQVHDDSGARDIAMHPGTCLYMPTGTPHAAHTEDAASLHVTVGINETTYGDLLRRVVEDALDDDSFRQPLPPGYAHNPDALAPALSDRLSMLAEVLAAQDSAALAGAASRRFLTTRPSRLRGSLRDRLETDDIADDTVLHRRRGSVCELYDEGERVRVLLGDRAMRVPGYLAAPLEHIRSNASVRPRDLAEWLDPESRLVLVRRLVREGLLRL